MYFYQQALAYFINKHHAVQIQSKRIASFLFIIYYLQLCGLLLDVEEEHFYDGTLINLLNVFKYISNICKPYQYLLEFQQFRLYCFLMPGLLLILQQIGLIVDQISENFLKQINRSAITDQHKYSSSETEKILSILFQTHIYLFSLYSVDLLIISITEAQNTNLLIAIISYFLLVFEILFVVINIASSQSVEFENYPLRISYPLKIYYANFLFIVFSIILGYQDFPECDILKHILNFIVFGIYLKIEIRRKTSTLQKTANIILCLGFSYNIIGLIFMDYFEENQIGLVIILCPFLINILTKVQQQQNQIDYQKNRKIDQIYNNLQLIQQEQKQEDIQQLDILIMLRMKSDFETDPFRSELRLLNQTILKSQSISKINWYLKYIAVKIAIMECSDALSLIHNLVQQLLYCEVEKKYVKFILHFTFIQKLQIEQMKSKIYEKIFLTMERNNYTTRNQSSNFIEYKVCLIKLRQSLQTLFVRKEEIYYLILEQKQSSYKKVFELSLQLISDAFLVQASLQQQLKTQKTYHIKQMLMILYVEFFNQIASAEQLRSLELQNNDEIQLTYLEQMEYLGLRIYAEEQDVFIFDLSTNFMKSLGYKKIKDLQDINFKNFFSIEYYQSHLNHMRDFLQTGKSKLIEKMHLLFIRGYGEIYYETQFLLTFLSNYDNGIKFYCFIKVSENQPKTLFINEKNQIVGVTTSFMTLLNELNVNFSSQQLITKDIQKFIRNFSQLQLNRFSKQSIFGSQNEYLLLIKQSLNLIELSVIDESEVALLHNESLIQSDNQNFEPNQESEVVIPILSSDEDIQYPKSTLTKRENHDHKLYESYAHKFMILNSKVNSEHRSEPLSINLYQQGKNEVIQQNYQRDKQSSKLSRGFLEQALYHQKYMQLELFLNITKKQLIIIFFVLIFIALLVNFCFQMISIVYVLPQYQKVNQDADSLSVKSYFITPIHSCTCSQYSSLSYLLYAAYKVITTDVYLHKLKFSQDSVYKSFHFLQSSFTTQLSNTNLQTYFTDKILEIQQIEGTQLVSRNISLKNALYYYYESQYFIINANSDVSSLKTTDFSIYVSNSFVYYMANILVVDNYFNNLSQLVLESIQERTILLKNNYTELFLKLIYLQIFCFFLVFSIILKIFTIRRKVLNMFGKLNIFAARLQLQQIIKVRQMLNQDKAYFYYSFDLKSWEKHLQEVSLLYYLKLNQAQTKSLNYYFPLFRIFSAFLIFSSVFLIPIIILELVNKIFLEKYQNSCNFLNQLSETSSAIVAVYELKETNYLINGNSTYFYFFNDDKRLEYNEKILAELDKIQQFQENITQIDFNSLLVNQEFINLIDDIKNSSLCNYLVHFSQELAIEHCNNVYSGVMNLGLINTLSEIYKQINLEYQNTDGFQLKNRKIIGPFEEFEAALITSDAIFYIQIALYNHIITQTEIILILHKIINYCYIFIDIIVSLILCFVILPFIVKKQKQFRNLIFLVPKYQLYLDQKFETEFRWLVTRFN